MVNYFITMQHHFSYIFYVCSVHHIRLFKVLRQSIVKMLSIYCCNVFWPVHSLARRF